MERERAERAFQIRFLISLYATTLADELHLRLVFSNQAHAEIVDIDPSAALAIKGDRGFFSAEDIIFNGRNQFGAIIHDEEIFASQKVTSCGQVLACVVADTLALAQHAVRFHLLFFLFTFLIN